MLVVALTVQLVLGAGLILVAVNGFPLIGGGGDTKSDRAPAVAPPVPKPTADHFDAPRAFALIRRELSYGQRPAGSPQLRRLAEVLRRELPNGHFEPVPGHPGLRNVVGTIPGGAPAIVVGAHYDSEYHPKGFVGAMPGGVALLINVLEFFILAGAMAGLFHYVPNTHVRWRHALFGGLFVAVGFEVAKRGLALYLGSVPSFANIYGAFATVPILLIWIYLGWVIVLLGAVMTAYAPSLKMRVVRRAKVPGYRFDLALSVLRELAAAREGARHGVAAAHLSKTLRTDPLQIEPLLDTLVGMDWLGRLDEEGQARYVLLCDPARTRAEPLFSHVLLGPSPSVAAFWQQAGLDRIMLQDILQTS